MGVVQNAMNLKNVDPFYQYVVSGTILLLAVLFDRVKQDAQRHGDFGAAHGAWNWSYNCDR